MKQPKKFARLVFWTPGPWFCSATRMKTQPIERGGCRAPVAPGDAK